MAEGPRPADIAADIAALVARADVAELLRLAEGPDRARAKAARRGLHQLRSRGIKTAAPPAARPRASAPAPRPAEELPCLASSIDAGGERVIWLVRPARGGLDLYEAFLQEKNGLTGFRATEASRKAFRQLWHDLRAERSFTVAEVPFGYARAEVEDAYRRNLQTGRAAPADFLRLRPQLGRAEPLAVHPALERWPQAPEVPREALAHLHETPECRPWMPEPEELERVALKLEEVEQSRLLVDERQKRGARADVLGRAARDYFAPADRRERLRRRLLDTAYLIALADPTREADARAARAAADLFLPEGAPEESPFGQRFFEKCFALPPGAPPDAGTGAGTERTSGGLIVPP